MSDDRCKKCGRPAGSAADKVAMVMDDLGKIFATYGSGVLPTRDLFPPVLPLCFDSGSAECNRAADEPRE